MAMIKFPFFTTQELNLDWVMQKLKALIKFIPQNGSAGDVLQRTYDGAVWQPISAVSLDINGLTAMTNPDAADTLPIYDDSAQGNYKIRVDELMTAAPVQSVNGQTGVVTLVAPVTSVNGQTGDVTVAGGVYSVNSKVGAVVLNATDVGALPSTYTPPVTSVNGQTGDVTVAGGVYSVNSKVGAVVLDATDVGALPSTYTPPVTSVNGQTGAVTVSAVQNLMFGAATSVTITPPAGVTAAGHIIIQKTSDGKAFRLVGKLSVMKSTNSGPRTFTLTGVTVQAPASEVNVYYCGLKEDGESTFTLNYTNIYDCASIKVGVDGTISIIADQDYGNANTYTYYWFPSVIVTLE